MVDFDISKSIEELEGISLGEPNYPGDSDLAVECYRLRQKPLLDFTIDNMITLIGPCGGDGLEYIVPLALEKLETDPLIEGDYYPGDLLFHVLNIMPEFWKEYPQLGKRIRQVASHVQSEYLVVDPDKLVDPDRVVEDNVKIALKHFMYREGQNL